MINVQNRYIKFYILSQQTEFGLKKFVNILSMMVWALSGKHWVENAKALRKK